MAIGDVTARVHLIQVQLSGEKPRLYANVVREMEDTDGSKNTVGRCEIELDIERTEVQPLIDKIAASLKAKADSLKSKPEEGQFKGITLS